MPDGGATLASLLGTALLAADSSVLKVDAAALALLGAPPSTPPRALQVLEQVGEQHRAALQRIVERACAGAAGALELEMVGLDGARRWLQLHVSPRRNAHGAARSALMTLLDVTERRREDAVLAARAREFRTLAENVPDNVVLYDRACRVQYLNPGLAAELSRDLLPTVGLTPAERWPELEPVLEFQRLLQRVMSTGDPAELELPGHDAAGAPRLHHVRLAAARDESGEIVGAIAVGRDITEHQRRGEALRQTQKLEAIGRLAGGVAHDFNNLLTVIQGGLAALREEGLPPGERAEILDQVSETAERATRLTRQLLTFSRARTVELEDLDLNEVVRSMSRMLRRLIGEQIQLVERYAPGGAPVHADAGMMEQVILNLAVNARDAMPGGGHLTLRTDLLPAAAGGGAAAVGQVVLSVTDTGTGIRPEHRAHLFEPFFTTKERGQGTGMGLALVFGIVEQHGGRIEVQSTAGAGTCFQMYLPALERVPAQVLAPPAPPRHAGTETILLVEDDGPLQRMVQGALERGGYRVLAAGSATSALQLWAEHRGEIDLLLTDMVLPGMGGAELGERLQADDARLRVIYSSGYPREALGDACSSRELLEKPYGPEEILARVRTCLDAR